MPPVSSSPAAVLGNVCPAAAGSPCKVVAGCVGRAALGQRCMFRELLDAQERLCLRYSSHLCGRLYAERVLY
eukprot:365028-Chlamydomonas_euryale.AAC.22